MGYNKLTPQQEEQVKVMRKGGKSPQEVVDFFKATYQITMPLWKVSYITGKVQGEIPKGEPKHKSVRKIKNTDISQVSDDNIINLVEQLRLELEAYSKFVIGKIRLELMKVIGEARKKRINVGEDVKEYTAPEEKEI